MDFKICGRLYFSVIPGLVWLTNVSHVFQDGSCNGLQHYAALGRDVIGATSVNLMPCEVPQDVYSSVAQQVSRAVAAGGGSGSFCLSLD